MLTFHIGSSYNPPTILLEARLRLVGQPFCQHLPELGIKGMISYSIFDQMKTYLDNLSDENDLVAFKSIGKSFENRDIWTFGGT